MTKKENEPKSPESNPWAAENIVPDVRDGLTKKQRAILYCLYEAQKEFGDRNVPTITLYGRVLEHVDISKDEFQLLLSQMAGMTRDTHL